MVRALTRQNRRASLSGRLSRLTTRAIRWSCLTYIMNPTTLTVTPGSMAVERRPVQPARQPQLLACRHWSNAVRSTGARQIIVAGGLKYALLWQKKHGVALYINDPNIVYTKHPYNQVASGTPATWDAMWGYFKGTRPLYAGEWALLPNTTIPVQCQGATMAGADKQVNSFLNYMQQNGISWTAWQFEHGRIDPG